MYWSILLRNYRLKWPNLEILNLLKNRPLSTCRYIIPDDDSSTLFTSSYPLNSAVVTMLCKRPSESRPAWNNGQTHTPIVGRQSSSTSWPGIQVAGDQCLSHNPEYLESRILESVLATQGNEWYKGIDSLCSKTNYRLAHSSESIGYKICELLSYASLGNKYYEDMGELPLRERWVEYAISHEYDSTQIEPGWWTTTQNQSWFRHAWMTYMTNEPPTLDPIIKVGNTNPKWERAWTGTATQTKGAYQPYSTVKLKYSSANDTLKPKEREG